MLLPIQRLLARSMILAFYLVAAVGCQPEAEFAPPPPPKVTVATPVRMDVTLYMEETGYTEPVAMIELRARVEGFLDRACVPDGSDVQAGETLFIIDKRPFEAEVAKAEAAVTVSRASEEDAKAKFLRARALSERNAISKEELDEKTAAFLVAQANTLAANAALDQARLELSYCEIKAPVDGRMGANLIDEGNFVGRGMTTHLGTMISYDPIYARVNISERDLLALIRQDRESRQKRSPGTDSQDAAGGNGRLRPVAYMALEGEDDFRRQGYLDYVELGVEASTGTFGVRAVFPNPPVADRQVPDIAPGMTVRVRVPLGTLKDALLIPEAAISTDQRGRFARIVNAENIVVRRDLRLGVKVADMMVIADGIQADDRVVIGNLQRARESMPVEIETTKTLELPSAGVLPPPALVERLPNDPAVQRSVSGSAVGDTDEPAAKPAAEPAAEAGGGGAARSVPAATGTSGSGPSPEPGVPAEKPRAAPAKTPNPS